MRVVGFDPGIAIVGCCVVDEKMGKTTLLSSHAITTPAKTSTASRLLTIYNEVIKILEQHKPEFAVMESLFFNTNVTTALTVGQARGVIQLALEQHNIPIAEYTPMQVKLSITGYGHADKNQMQMMVKQILKLKEILTPDDIADAAAIALTHCFSYKLETLKAKG